MTSKTKAKTVAKNVKKSSIKIPDSTVRIMRNYMKFNDLLEAKYGTRILLNSFISLWIKEWWVKIVNGIYDMPEDVEFVLKED